MNANPARTLGAAVMLAALALSLLPGCGTSVKAEPLEVTYYYLPG